MPVINCEAARTINASIERVWDIYSDLTLRSALVFNILNIPQIPSERMLEGATWVERRKAFRAEQLWTMTALTVDPHSQIILRAKNHSGDFTITVNFARKSSRTHVRVQASGKVLGENPGQTAVIVMTKPLVLSTVLRSLKSELFDLANAAEYGLPVHVSSKAPPVVAQKPETLAELTDPTPVPCATDQERTATTNEVPSQTTAPREEEFVAATAEQHECAEPTTTTSASATKSPSTPNDSTHAKTSKQAGTTAQKTTTAIPTQAHTKQTGAPPRAHKSSGAHQSAKSKKKKRSAQRKARRNNRN